MRYILLVAITLILAGCGSATVGTGTIKDTFYITAESDLPDPDMARSEMVQQTRFFLKKAIKVNQAKFIFTRFQGKEHIQIVAEPAATPGGGDVSTTKTGYRMRYRVKRSAAEMTTLKKYQPHFLTATGSNAEAAFQSALEGVIKKVAREKGDATKVSGVFTIVDMGMIRYGKKSVSYDLTLIVVPEKVEALSGRDQANYLGDLALLELNRKKTEKAKEYITQGLDLDEQCDRCHYARGQLRLIEGDAGRALFNVKKALEIDGDKLLYYQMIQKIYLLTKDHENSKKIAHKIVRKFNPDGTLIIREKAPVSGKDLVIKAPALEEYQLGNKLGVTLIKQHTLPLVQFSVGLRFGSAHAPDGKQGVVKGMITLLKEGSKGMDQGAIARFIDQNGLYFWSSVQGDYTQINCATLKENGSACLKLFSEVLLQPAFPEREFNKYMKKQVQLYQVKSARQGFLASKLLYRLLYNKHPYMYYDATLKTLTSIKLDDVKQLYKKLCHSGNAHLILTGDIDQKLKNEADTLFGAWGGGEQIKDYGKDRVKTLPEAKPVIYLVHQPNRPQSTILYGNLITPYQSDQFIPMLIANEIFGGNASSHLFMELREKQGLTYGVYSGLSRKIQKGVMVIQGQVRAEATAQAIMGILGEIKKVHQKGFTPEELKDKQRLIAGKVAISLQETSALNDYILKQKFFGMKNQSISQYLQKINQLTVSDLNNAFQSLVKPKQSVIVVAGDYKKVLPKLKQLSTVYVFDQNFKQINVR